MNYEVTIEQVLQLSNAIIIDIRSKYKYSLGHIPGAKHVLVDDLLDEPAEHLNYNDTYYLYCEYGAISDRVATTLSRLGYHTYSVKDGYYAYLEHESMI